MPTAVSAPRPESADPGLAGQLAVEHQRRNPERSHGDEHPGDEPHHGVERRRRGEHAAALLRSAAPAIALTAELATLLRSTRR